jgi:dTDP-glucose 4,6-dehydratase
MSLDGKRVLVTGAGGFIGSHLTEALVRAGAQTRAMVHYNCRSDPGQLRLLGRDVRDAVDTVFGDVRDRRAVRETVEGCQIVFHLAALVGIPYSYLAAESYAQTNMVGTMNVLEACRDVGVERVLQTSTSEVYGTAQYTPIDEGHPLHSQSPYAATKVGSDQLALSYHASFGLPVVIVRPFNTYGPRQSARAVIPTIVSQALEGDEIRLGNTSPIRDFLFVADTANGFLAAAGSEASAVCGEVFNLGTGRGVTIGHLVELVGRCLGRSLRVNAETGRERPVASEVFELVACAEKAAGKLNWRPAVTLEEGIKRTIQWIDRHRDLYRPKAYSV